ncbi:hypothetical protein ANCCAN_23800 [Ancylostoma caninum]|uniref:Uncharacterized protein n=1 Tax=Ancylostoma caninum TaxID=29170 RepID=A0A368FE13_ANCCA|nr:hypothetical protein ANCCAN_23800 [Ancylostoma caninum]
MEIITLLLSTYVPTYSQLIPEPTRPIDLWNPFGPTSTPRPKNQVTESLSGPVVERGSCTTISR